MLRALLLAIWILVDVTGTAGAQPIPGADLVNTLRRGGCVLVMRHTSSPSAPPDKAAADPENVRQERQLDETGRRTASEMGEAVKRLGISIGTVLSSPAYRALQTVRLASLGTAKVVPELDAGGQNMMQAATDTSRSTWLRQEIAQRPPAGSNTIIVTHGPNIIGAFGPDASGLSDGETLVFLPDGKGGARLLGRIKIDEWPRFAAQRKE
jgi:phosphohistidine phosphatase SixA